MAGFTGIGDSNICAQNKILFRLSVFYVAEFVILSLMILFLSFYWVQRYSNSPGNFVFFLMFVSYYWNPSFFGQMVTIGVLCLVVTLLTLLVNAVAGIKGITTGMKKVIVVFWIIGLLVMIIN